MRPPPDGRLARFTELHPRSIDLSLGRIRRLLGRLGHPERDLGRVVHVAGTNGKGSVVAMLAAVERAAGRTVNAYVSPHLVRFNERIQLDGSPIGDAELERAAAEAERANAGEPITFFEITTAVALLAFRSRPAEVTLLETGLGGRLDATNVVERPELAVITPVGLDHRDRLGATLPAIAAEKAGILKEGVPAVVGPQDPAAMEVVTARALELGAPLHRSGIEWRVDRTGGGARYVDAAGREMRLATALAGEHQTENAGIVAACLAAAPSLAAPEGALLEGLGQVRWPGRLQRLRGGPLADLAAPGEVWVDVGHNPDAARALAAWGREGPPLRLVAGLLRSKDAAAFFEAFRGVAEHVFAVPAGPDVNGWSPDELARAAAQAGLTSTSCEGVEAAVRGQAAAGRILVAGSFALAGQALALSGDALDGAGVRRTGPGDRS